MANNVAGSGISFGEAKSAVLTLDTSAGTNPLAVETGVVHLESLNAMITGGTTPIWRIQITDTAGNVAFEGTFSTNNPIAHYFVTPARLLGMKLNIVSTSGANATGIVNVLYRVVG